MRLLERRADCPSKSGAVEESALPFTRAESVELDPSQIKPLTGSRQLIDDTSHKAGISNAKMVFTRAIVLLTQFTPNRSIQRKRNNEA